MLHCPHIPGSAETCPGAGFGSQVVEKGSPARWNMAVKPKPGWYRGDFHVHTTASDGFHSPSQVVEVARAKGLDFIAITDHNTVAAFAELAPRPDFVVIPGLEVTLDSGDFNVFGVAEERDWMKPVCTSRKRHPLADDAWTTTALMRRTAMEGLLNSINHPLLHPWGWQDRATDLRYVHCLEVWNDPLWPDNVKANPEAVALWTAWLNAGYRVTAIGGSDYHAPPGADERRPGEVLGLPTTYVYAEALSGAAILEGLHRHRVYVSIGPRVTFQAQAAGARYNIGDDLGEYDGEVEFSAAVTLDGATAGQSGL